MNNKSLFLLLVVYCTSSMVYARDYNSKYYIEIDYQFSINCNDIDKGKLEFQLYDESKSFVFNSVYDSLTDTYKFQEHSNSGDF